VGIYIYVQEDPRTKNNWRRGGPEGGEEEEEEEEENVIIMDNVVYVIMCCFISACQRDLAFFESRRQKSPPRTMIDGLYTMSSRWL